MAPRTARVARTGSCAPEMLGSISSAAIAIAILITLTTSAEAQPERVGSFPQQIADSWTEADGLPSNDVRVVKRTREGLWAATAAGNAFLSEGEWLSQPPLAFNGLDGLTESQLGTSDGDGPVFALRGAPGKGCPEVAGTESGLYLSPCGAADNEWQRLLPHEAGRGWSPRSVRGVSFDGDGGLWFVSSQGAGRLDLARDEWRLWDERDGLPYLDLTCIVAVSADEAWLGTTIGAIHYRDGEWEYRQGKRWLPGDEIRDIAVAENGDVWLATDGGVARIHERQTTLAEKAAVFEEQIDRFHRRTPYEYVLSVGLAEPGETSRFTQHDSDNDGLWTGMYGAAESFAWAATRDPQARRRARQAFEALRFLSEVPQGGSHPADRGFIARTILPTTGPDPNIGRLERDRARKAEADASWKLIDPRWPTSADGRWYWKTDASSDELDGHFFFYAVYYDLVADSDEERREVRDVILRIVDHLLDHDYSLVDHDGLPTRWAVFGPEQLNQGPLWWGERGLNSMSLVSYLRVASHVSDDPRYDEAARELIEVHDYAANIMVPKVHTGPGTGNQSDDEMAFMGFYNLLNYEHDLELRALWARAFFRYWRMEEPERNPLFNFLYAATYREDTVYSDAFGPAPLAPTEGWLEDSIDTLKRYPLDRVDWGLRNSHRQDLEFLDDLEPLDDDSDGSRRGHLRNGKVLPIDERFVEHWNHDPWRLDYAGQGHKLADGASFLLPYYLGLYHGFLTE